MSKRNKIIYWVATIWMAVAFLLGGIAQLVKLEQTVKLFNQLGYPLYFSTMLGVAKILGVVAVLIPKFPLLKEWAYAGFVFVVSGAIISHITMGDSAIEIAPRIGTLSIVIVSWYYRPLDRKITLANI
ncbi:DoxX family protein [Algoriphagus sp.]|uniref:DoxX family protein n=1 Tax=Algoriphagus sp. TaxID=1872435 RepID=UPI003F6E56E4